MKRCCADFLVFTQWKKS